MKKTILGIDYITLNENNIDVMLSNKDKKVHLIKLDFEFPTKEKVLLVIDMFTKTNRYVISNNIRIYNDILRTTGKKYYIENEIGTNLISYLRKNNKILINFNNLRKHELLYVLDQTTLFDLLRNVEVVLADDLVYTTYKSIFDSWDGNLIVSEDK